VYLISLFLKRQNDPIWKTVSYIQSNVKAEVGIGEQVHFYYNAFVNVS
jgi:hypothetical protein